jgi:hypothetical protein
VIDFSDLQERVTVLFSELNWYLLQVTPFGLELVTLSSTLVILSYM